MKKILGIALSIALFGSASTVEASFRIALKNGSEVLTNRYWEEKNMIKFNSRGGIAGISKDQVLKITETGEVYREGYEKEEASASEKGIETEGALSESNPALEKARISPGKAGLPALPGATDNLERYRERKQSLKEGFDRAEQDYLEAISRKNKIMTEAARKKMIEFSKMLNALAEEVKKNNNGKLPDGWNNL